MAERKRLWEVNHPYYMNEGSYHNTDLHNMYETLDEFLSVWGDAEIDRNRIHRWDWCEGEDLGVESDGSDDVIGELNIYYIMQKKAITCSCSVAVRRSDEPRVFEFLQPHFEQEIAIWEPFTSQVKIEVGE